MKLIKKLIGLVLFLIVVIFYIFRFRTGTLPIGIPKSLEVNNVEILETYEHSQSSKFPIEVRYSDKWDVERNAIACNLFIPSGIINEKKVIIEYKTKNFKTGETEFWVYGIF